MSRKIGNIIEHNGDALEKLLKQLPEKAHRRAIRAGVTAGTQVIVSDAKKRAKGLKESGALAKAITKKVYTDDEKQIHGIVGADKNVTIEYQGETRRPANYLHLVEFGHIDAAGNFVEGHGILSKAQQSTKGKQLAKFEAKTREKMDKETLKLAQQLGALR